MNLEPWSAIAIGYDGRVARGIQHLLRAHGHAVVVDGAFGPATEAAVASFQNAQGLPGDGVVGPITWPRLVVDGQFGALTEEQVRFHQYWFGLTFDGVAGRETWAFKVAPTDPWPLVKAGVMSPGVLPVELVTPPGYRVPIVQHLLRAHGATIAADGSYGPATGEAVRQFQLTLRATYISTTVGQLDWPALVVTARLGDSGEAVRAVQSALTAHGYPVAVDGDFGPLTDAAVRAFQARWLSSVDGIVGPLTWRRIVDSKYDD
jgi:peptidoglycan hydrolase-like protein with peptidoglycan-binding domain